MTGLNWTVRRLVADTTSWKAKLALDPDAYGTGGVSKQYHKATYRTQVFDRYGATPGFGCTADTVDVVSVGNAHAGSQHRHELKATYVRTCFEPEGAPPWVKYATVSDRNFDVRGEIRVWSADESVNSNVHSNRRLMVDDKAYIEGFGTQSRSSGGGCPSDPNCTDDDVVEPYWDGDKYPIFDPNDDDNGGEPDFLRSQPIIEIEPLIPSEWEPKATYVEGGDIRINSNTTINFTDYRGITTHGTKDNPFIWYIPGDLEVNADLFQMIGYVVVIVEGGVKIDGDAKFITGVPAGITPPSTSYSNPNVNSVRSWMATHMAEGTTMGLYAAGCYDGDCGNSGIHLNGKATVVGQLFANNDISINGDAVVFGAITTRGVMDYNGKNVIWYSGANGAITSGGAGQPLPDGIRLLSIVEF